MFRAIETVGKFAKRYGTPLMLTAAVCTASGAMGQTRPGVRPMDDPRRDMRDRDLRDRTFPRDDSERSTRETNSSDFPTTELHSAVEANARAAYARANYRRLQSSLDQAIRHMQSEFDASADMVDAMKAEQQAWDAYVSTRNGALKGVMSDPNYRANIALKADLGDKIAEYRADALKEMCGVGKAVRTAVDASVMKELVNMATVKLDYAQVATDMEVAALRNDAKVSDARSKLMSAGAKVQGLRDRFDRTLRDSQELASIRDRIEDARLQVITSEAFQNGANVVAGEALDYAYYKNRFNYNFTYPDGGYGYGNYRY